MQAAVRTDFRTFLATGVGSGDLAARTTQRLTSEVAFYLAAQFRTLVQAAVLTLGVVGITLVFRSLGKTMTASATVHQRNRRGFRSGMIVACVIAMVMIVTCMIVARMIIMRGGCVGRGTGDWR